MTLASWILFAAAVCGVVWVMRPLLLPETVVERDDPLAVRRELLARREMLFASIRDLEDDRDAGRLDDIDYASLRGALDRESVEVLARLEALDGEAC